MQCGALSLQTRALAKKPASGQGPRLPPNPLLTPHLPAGRTMQVAPQAGWAGPSGLRPPTVPPAAPQAEATVQRGPHPLRTQRLLPRAHSARLSRVVARPRSPHTHARTHSRRGRAPCCGRVAPGRDAPPLFASGGGKLSQRDDHESQHHAGGQQGGDDDGRDGAGPQRACGGRRASQPRARPARPSPGPPCVPGPSARPRSPSASPVPPSASPGPPRVPAPWSRRSRAVLSSGLGAAVGAGAPVAAGSRAGLLLSTGPSPDGSSAGSFHRVGTGSCGPSAARPRTEAGAQAVLPTRTGLCSLS